MDAIEDSHSNISRHLKILRTAKLVKEKKEGKWAYFSLADSDSAFHKNLLQAIRSIPGEYFAEDSGRLKLRLSLREDGKCIDGLKSEKWMAAHEAYQDRRDKSLSQKTRTKWEINVYAEE